MYYKKSLFLHYLSCTCTCPKIHWYQNVNYRCPLFITLFRSEFTWCTLHKPALSQLRMVGMQSQCRLLLHGRIVLHFDFQHLQRQSLDCHQHIHACCDDEYSVRSSGSHCTPVSRRRDRWSLQVSSTLLSLWKHSTLHTVHCGC